MAHISAEALLTSYCSLRARCLPVCTALRLHHSDSQTRSHTHRPGNIGAREQRGTQTICVCVCVHPLTCWRVPCGHRHPGVQFLLRSNVRSMHDTAPIMHCIHSWPGGHFFPSSSTAAESEKRAVKSLQRNQKHQFEGMKSGRNV